MALVWPVALSSDWLSLGLDLARRARHGLTSFDMKRGWGGDLGESLPGRSLAIM